MKKFPTKLFVLIGFCIVSYISIFRGYTWHQKLTITIERDGQLFEGSSVTEARRQMNPINGLAGSPITSRTLGEAVVVKLPDGQYLFALRKGEKYEGNIDAIHYSAFAEKTKNINGAEGKFIFLTNAPVGTKASVPRKAYPLLVTFEDINNPATIKRVDSDDLAATFGAGYSLKSITLELTNESKTEGQFERLLPCLYSNKACVPVNWSLAYGNPMRNILNQDFRR